MDSYPAFYLISLEVLLVAVSGCGRSLFRHPVRAGAADIHDGHNVVFHEFAHQLDTVDGHADGVPVLPGRSLYIAWARILSREYERLCEDKRRGRHSLLDQYGGTNAAEFFAVATECFFEKPRQI